MANHLRDHASCSGFGRVRKCSSTLDCSQYYYMIFKLSSTEEMVHFHMMSCSPFFDTLLLLPAGQTYCWTVATRLTQVTQMLANNKLLFVGDRSKKYRNQNYLSFNGGVNVPVSVRSEVSATAREILVCLSVKSFSAPSLNPSQLDSTLLFVSQLDVVMVIWALWVSKNHCPIPWYH